MDRWKLWSVLLLTIPFYIDSEETKQLHKTIGSKPDVTPICSNETSISSVVFTLVKTIGGGPDITPVCTKEALSNFEVLCKISTERTRGKNCRLRYQHEWGVVNICDSRFTLTTKNQTVFLHLTSLTPGDSGNYTLQSSSSLSWISIIVICVPGVILGLILRRKRCKGDTRSEEFSACEIPGSFDQDDPDDLYDSLEQPASDVYESFSTHIEDDGKKNSASDNIETADLKQEVDEKTDEEWEIYENI
ncbi:hypothetical protein D5F01_LYC23295 [Larimichthys crocea]|uniref:Immunoglobulin subtype domain-containing protein n=1 Tax=Larimichthys crocea TaxID=215358 RepID=A0A6G0HH29_LARCR|nr:hypothetical protein D5F01_LYC23295 [Larimichthys crocea]